MNYQGCKTQGPCTKSAVLLRSCLVLTKELKNENFKNTIYNSHKTYSILLKCPGTSLAVQWLRIRLPMQGTRVRALVQEDPTGHGATKPVHHNYWARAPRARAPQLLSPRATTTEAHVPRACALQQEKPPQWEAHAPQRIVPARHNQRKPANSNKDPMQPKINKFIF